MAGQEFWEREGSVIEVQGYKWLGKPRKIQNSQRGVEVQGYKWLCKPRKIQNSQRGEGRCWISNSRMLVEFITNVNFEECLD